MDDNKDGKPPENKPAGLSSMPGNAQQQGRYQVQNVSESELQSPPPRSNVAEATKSDKAINRGDNLLNKSETDTPKWNNKAIDPNHASAVDQAKQNGPSQSTEQQPTAGVQPQADYKQQAQAAGSPLRDHGVSVEGPSQGGDGSRVDAARQDAKQTTESPAPQQQAQADLANSPQSGQNTSEARVGATQQDAKQAAATAPPPEQSKGPEK